MPYWHNQTMTAQEDSWFDAIAVELRVTRQTSHIIQNLLLDKSWRPQGIAGLMWNVINYDDYTHANLVLLQEFMSGLIQ